MAFPELPYFAPHHFPLRKALSTRPLGKLTEWGTGEIELLPIEGMPKVNEHVVYHPRSKTLVVADLCFNFESSMPTTARVFFRAVAGIREYPGMSRFFRWMIRDREAFECSLQGIFERDFYMFNNGTFRREARLVK